MRKILAIVIVVLSCLNTALAASTTLVMPTEILQGNPLRVTTEGAPFLKEVIFDGKSIPTFMYNGKIRAFIGIDLAKKPGSYALKATLTTGEVLTRKIAVIGRRKPVVESVTIPEKLGGTSSSSQANLVTSISQENADIHQVRTGIKITWSNRFIPPLAAMTVTNPYGYGVSTGEYTVPHKGADLKAKIGTDVFAMNRGVVKIARGYRVYGKTILLDHGLGLQTLYLHLSKMNVKEGDVVERGKVIGLSGDTGYVSGPHLHLSIKIGGISIDPMKFLNLFGF